ncbi:secretagogin-like [Clytia hemisphaerica]|uniref:EF-hand domain-containing protein n=1 Tax=Clytia hemisphaerica TaxID=252671 RepID=A0A7M5X981_9CNID|eukprot:TCONS_00048833-protein
MATKYYKNMSEKDFLDVFRKEYKVDAVTFMKAFEEADEDGNGQISSSELIKFLKALGVDAKETEELKEHIIELYDKNHDGKLGLTELSKLLQSDQNVLKAFVEGEDLTEEKFNEVFAHYDRDNGGTINNSELSGFLKDMKSTQDVNVESKELKEYEIWILGEADKNNDGELSKDELRMLFFG